MATIKGQIAAGRKPAIQALDNTPARTKDSIQVTTAINLTNNVFQLGVLPAGCVPVGYVVEIDGIDSGVGLVWDFGIQAYTLSNNVPTYSAAISTATADGAAKWISGSTSGRSSTGAIALHTASKATYDVLAAVTPVEYDRVISLVLTTQAATAVQGNVQAELWYQQARP